MQLHLFSTSLSLDLHFSQGSGHVKSMRNITISNSCHKMVKEPQTLPEYGSVISNSELNELKS